MVIHALSDSVSYDAPVYVSRIGYQAATRNYTSRLSVVLSDDKSTVIKLSFDDVCIQRAEDILNTVIAVYNETGLRTRTK